MIQRNNRRLSRQSQQKPTIIGSATLYLGDCHEILPTLDIDRRKTALVADPPYGSSFDTDYTQRLQFQRGPW